MDAPQRLILFESGQALRGTWESRLTAMLDEQQPVAP
jgi:hypothetical protein